jgi:hypothetical protein
MKGSSSLPQTSRLSLLLQANGLMSAGALTQELSVSQATLSRWMRRLGPDVERTGAARSTRYALRRNVRNLGTHWPIYRFDQHGHATRWGDLRALYGGFRFVPDGAAPVWLSRDYPEGLFAGLPFFLQDVRPQGYLGRAVARRVSQDLGAPSDPRAWTDDGLVSYLLSEGHDLSGDLVLGDRALERALRRLAMTENETIREPDRPVAYSVRAETVQRGGVIGSSTGGEQPKFLATVQRNAGDPISVMVKFSAAEASTVRQRWADLLLCEHIAAQVLERHQIPSARTQVLDGGGRRFLEVERFDRFQTAGRRGLLTLGTVEDALSDQDSSDSNWAASATRLASIGVMSAEGSRQLCWRWCFGDLIANSDMHRSNTSLWFGDSLPFELTPSYDMLPMLFAPGPQGNFGDRLFSPRPPLPAIAEVWSEAARPSSEFWDLVAADDRVSSDFRSISVGAASEVRRLVARFG